MLLYSLYGQLTHDKIPEKATHSVESQIEELQQVAAKRLVATARKASQPLFLLGQNLRALRERPRLGQAATTQ